RQAPAAAFPEALAPCSLPARSLLAPCSLPARSLLAPCSPPPDAPPSRPVGEGPALVVEEQLGDAERGVPVRLPVSVIEVIDGVAVHEHVAVTRGGPLDLVPLDDQGPAAVEQRGAVPVDVGSHDVRGAPHGDAIGEVVDAPPLAGAAETPGDEQVIVATAVKQHGRLDLRG